MVCSIEESNDVTSLTIDELQSSLLVHEQRMNGQKEEEQALRVSNSGRMGSRGRGRNSNRGGRGRGRQFFNRGQIECFKCHKFGHYQYECPNSDENVNYAEFDDEEEILLMAQTESKTFPKKQVWFLESGCSNHMCGCKDWFYDLDENYRTTVKLGDNSRMSVMGKGSINLNIEGRVHTVIDVFYILELKNHLLSIGQLQERKLEVFFKENKCKVYHKQKGLLLQSEMSSN